MYKHIWRIVTGAVVSTMQVTNIFFWGGGGVVVGWSESNIPGTIRGLNIITHRQEGKIHTRMLKPIVSPRKKIT